MLFERTSYLSLLVSVAALVGLSACTTPKPAPAPIQSSLPAPVSAPPPINKPVEIFKAVRFDSLPGWSKDNVHEAWPAFMNSCDVLIKKSDWKEPCSIANELKTPDAKAVRAFFEAFFVPYQVVNPDGTDSGLVTGYYEPLLRGARKRGGPYQTPLHRVPDDMLMVDLSSQYPELQGLRLRGRYEAKKIVPYYSRAELMQADRLAGKEILWVDNPIDAFFLQVQGSGRVQLSDTKETVRLAYADQNGYPYRSIGRYLVDKGEMTLDQASAQSIKSWVAANPKRTQELLNANPSYVFFKEEAIADPQKGPKGAMGVPLTPQRSIAVDPKYVPMGAPVFLATTQPNSAAPLQRLMLAQDTGSAIKNAVRADYFWGFGANAGEKAGRMKQRGAMWVLLPKVTEPIVRTMP